VYSSYNAIPINEKHNTGSGKLKTADCFLFVLTLTIQHVLLFGAFTQTIIFCKGSIKGVPIVSIPSLITSTLKLFYISNNEPSCYHHTTCLYQSLPFTVDE